MKKACLLFLAGVVHTATTYGQGTVNFCNYFTGTAADPVVYFADGVTRVAGSQYIVAFMGGPTAQNLTLCATTTFYPGAPGYFIGPTAHIPNVPGGTTAFIQIDVWDLTLEGTTTGATFAQAVAFGQASGLPNIWGQSTIFANPTGNPYSPGAPGVPADLVNLTSFSLVPEPSIFSLFILCLTATVIRRSYNRTI